MEGRVHRINVKPETPTEEGLPKGSVDAAWARRGGLEGDFNRYRHETQHDDPDAALLLMPLETIRELNAEGWPIEPGDLGENLTTTGIPYASLAPGTTYRVGRAEIQISRRCDPCTNLYLLPYVGAAKGPAFLQVMTGRRGWYARVLREGVIRRGDPITERAPA
ncbi:MAG TPA: MOSC domain-containing protein [Thermoplasmata archaeon]|nr:MOSC domain-containing protein [Thermoplasmata archaeon]